MNKTIKSTRQLPLTFHYQASFQPEDLVITQSNRAASTLIHSWPRWALPIAILLGPEGAGKSHFSMVWKQNTQALQVDASNLAQDLEKIVGAVEVGQPVLLEDVDQYLSAETALFHLMNTIKQAAINCPSASLLMTARSLPSQWNVQLKDLKSRLNSATLVTLDPPDDHLLTAVAFKLFADRQIFIKPSLVNYLISHSQRSLSMLGQVIEQADMLALQKKSKITRQLIAEILEGQSRESYMHTEKIFKK